MSGNRWSIIVMLMAFAAIGHFNRVGITVAGDEVFIPTTDIKASDMGWVYTIFLIVYTIGMLPAGWLIDRIGSGRALAMFGITMGFFVVLTGMLGWLTQESQTLLIGLLVIRGLAGLCNAPLHPGAAHVVSDVMSPAYRATANGMVTAGALVGIACCYPAFGWLMDRLSWQVAFIVSGTALMAFALIWRILVVPVLPHAHVERPPEPASSAPDLQSVPVGSLLMDSNLWLLTLSYAAYGYFQYLFFYWMGYYFKEELEVPPVDARWAQFWIMLAMGAGMWLGGAGTDLVCRYFGTIVGRRCIVMTGMILGAVFGTVGAACGSTGMEFEAFGLDVSSFLLVSVCLGFSMAAAGMVEGCFWTTATDIGGQRRGLAGAFMNTGGNAGGLIAPVLTPLMAAKINYSGSIVVACVISLVGGLLWFAIRPTVTTEWSDD